MRFATWCVTVAFKKHGEPAHQVTRVGSGPNGMTIKSSSAAVIDDYLCAK
jgi:hypothetical protein